jgi:hypothetical protein
MHDIHCLVKIQKALSSEHQGSKSAIVCTNYTVRLLTLVHSNKASNLFITMFLELFLCLKFFLAFFLEAKNDVRIVAVTHLILACPSRDSFQLQNKS